MTPAQTGTVLLTLALSTLAHAASRDDALPIPPGGPAPEPLALDLRLPSRPMRPSLAASAADRPDLGRPSRAMRFEPRKSLVEWGVEGSREALIACQKGAYPGATVASSGVLVAGGEGQPDHCYRF